MGQLADVRSAQSARWPESAEGAEADVARARATKHRIRSRAQGPRSALPASTHSFRNTECVDAGNALRGPCARDRMRCFVALARATSASAPSADSGQRAD